MRLAKIAVVVAVACQGSLISGQSRAAAAKAPADAGPPLPEVDPTFSVRDFVWAPAIHSPASIAVGADGRVFVAEDEYNSINETPVRAPGLDRVKLCVDTDGDGKADKITVFAKGLNSVQGMTFVGDTLFVVHAPYLSAFRDTDGDGVADQRVDLVTGLGQEPVGLVQHVPSGVHYGLDGFLYISVGDKGIWPEAVGRDGRKITLHGGGVVRVRPDGTELELYTSGQRNFMDVSISPTFDLFTRDNTNDGQGWNSRLTQVMRGANLGYPSLFVSFGDEIIQPLADYGAGSATGSQFVYEGVIPGEYGNALYTCDWARGAVYRHELTADGASFKVTQKEFVKKPGMAPTDVDVDGRGTIYVADWGRYAWGASGAVGAVYAVSDKAGIHGPVFPEVKKLSSERLVGLLRLRSAVYRREAQWEILRRRDASVESRLAALVEDPSADVGARVAGLFTIAQLRGKDARPFLERAVSDPVMREFALRAMADRDPFLKDMNPQIFLACLSDANPRVREQACLGLGRLKRAYTARWVVPLIADSDARVAQAAMIAARQIGDVGAVASYLSAEGTPSVVKGALRALRGMHRPASVDAMAAYLAAEKRPALRKEAVRTLARLYSVEAPWDGAWWSPWPDTRGPYYKQARWAGTPRVGEMFVDLIGDADKDVATAAVAMCGQCKVSEALPALADVVNRDGPLRSQAARAILEMKSSDPIAVAAMEKATLGNAFDAGVRADAVAALAGMDSPQARSIVIRLIGQLDADDNAGAVLDKACDALAAKGAGQAETPAVVKLLSARQTKVRVAAATALLRSNTAAAHNAVNAALAGKDAPATEAVLSAVAGIPAESSQALHDPVRARVTDQRTAVRQAALLAIGHLGEPQDVNALLAAAKKYADRDTVAEALASIEPGKVRDRELAPAAEILVARARAMSKGTDQGAYGRMLAVAQSYAADKRVPPDVARKWIAELRQSGVILAYQRTKMIPVPAGASPFATATSVEDRPGGPFAAFKVGAETVTWSPIESRDAKGIVSLEPVGNSAAYLNATLDGGSTGGWGLLSYGMDDGVQMWLNAKKVVSKDLDGQCRPDAEKEAVQLQPGTNVLLLKVDNHAGPCQVQARVRTRVNELDVDELAFVKSRLPGRVERGRELFTSLGCVKCHTVDAKEDRKGPYLGDAGSRLEVNAIIESIRKPSAKIAQGFQTTRVATTSGEEYIGFVVKESAEDLSVRDASGKVAVLDKAKVKSRQTLPGSIMPEGLTDGLSLQDFSSLVEYLQSMKGGAPAAAGVTAAATAK